jgi:hypothetical protein
VSGSGSPTLVEVRGADFAFTIAVCVDEAPVSSAYFLADVDAGVLNGSSIFRIVNVDNQPANHPAKIEVIQMGLRENDPTIASTILHESTTACSSACVMSRASTRAGRGTRMDSGSRRLGMWRRDSSSYSVSSPRMRTGWSIWEHPYACGRYGVSNGKAYLTVPRI